MYLFNLFTAGQQASAAKLSVFFLNIKIRVLELKFNETKPDTENASNWDGFGFIKPDIENVSNWDAFACEVNEEWKCDERSLFRIFFHDLVFSYVSVF